MNARPARSFVILVVLLGASVACNQPNQPSSNDLEATIAFQENQLSATGTQMEAERLLHEAASATPVPSDTPVPTDTFTPPPSNTPVPTATLEPSPTTSPSPSPTPLPTETPTPAPTYTPAESSSSSSASAGSCNDSSEGRQKVRVENKTDDYATLYFRGGPENYTCSIAPGVMRIYIKAGVYNISSYICGQTVSWGSHVINPTWYIVLRCPK